MNFFNVFIPSWESNVSVPSWARPARAVANYRLGRALGCGAGRPPVVRVAELRCYRFHFHSSFLTDSLLLVLDISRTQRASGPKNKETNVYLFSRTNISNKKCTKQKTTLFKRNVYKSRKNILHFIQKLINWNQKLSMHKPLRVD